MKPKEKRKTLSTRLRASLVVEFDAISRAEGNTRSGVVRFALECFLKFYRAAGSLRRLSEGRIVWDDDGQAA